MKSIKKYLEVVRDTLPNKFRGRSSEKTNGIAWVRTRRWHACEICSIRHARKWWVICNPTCEEQWKRRTSIVTTLLLARHARHDCGTCFYLVACHHAAHGGHEACLHKDSAQVWTTSGRWQTTLLCESNQEHTCTARGDLLVACKH